MGNPVPGDYEFLDTDYETWACVWSCFGDPLGLTHSEIGYILTREQEFNQETVDICLNLYREQGLNPMIEDFVTFYSGLTVTMKYQHLILLVNENKNKSCIS